jgi:hypothetical protein
MPTRILLFPRGTSVNAEDIKIGPIPLTLFIPLCLFGPILVMTLVGLYTSRSKRVDREMERQRHGGEDVEMQVEGFVGNGGEGRTREL